MFTVYKITRNDNNAVVGYVYAKNFAAAEICFERHFSERDFKRLFKGGVRAIVNEKQIEHVISLV